MADGNNAEILGKKVFFIHPSALTQNEIVSELAQQEYEVYVMRDAGKMADILRRYPSSAVFASVDEALPPKDWEAFIRNITENAETKSVAVGVIVNMDNDNAKRFYLNTLKISGGYVPLKPDTGKAIKNILEILKSVEAKGRRKYVRADTRDDPMASINISLNGKYINGTIWDISVVGLSCVFNGNPELEKNSLFPDIQIKLQSSILKVEGLVFGSRMDGADKVYVIVFTKKIDPVVRTKIRTYIQKNLQLKMDQEIK
ncbi:MAG: PilZ domain-containing protein [Treponema sp.]|jgi:hypothetical protein|nr:PilZ domain-containing protein [Treponema sp.]